MSVFKIKSAFTFAELLLALMIIGVIAATTIPTLVSNVQEHQHKAEWKNIFASLSQVTSVIMANNKGTLRNLCPGDFDNNCLRNKYLNYMKPLKQCNNGINNMGVCWASKWYSLDGTENPFIVTQSSAVLKNGANIMFNHHENSCTTSGWCGWIRVDVNGFSGPNIQGKDIFMAYLVENYIKPVGDGKACNGDGTNCSAYYMSH